MEDEISIQDFYKKLPEEKRRYVGPIEEGKYRVRVDRVELIRASQGMYLEWALVILDSEYEDGWIRKRHAITDMGQSLYQLRRDLELFGMKPEAVQALEDPKLLQFFQNAILEVAVQNTPLGQTVSFLRVLKLAFHYDPSPDSETDT